MVEGVIPFEVPEVMVRHPGTHEGPSPTTCAFSAASPAIGNGTVPSGPVRPQLPSPQHHSNLHKLSIASNVDNDNCEMFKSDISTVCMSAEYVQGKKPICVKGGLKKHLKFWQDIKANDFILDVVANGYRLPLAKEPPLSFTKNNRSAFKHPQFVFQAIQDLVTTGAVREVSEIPHVVNPLTVAENKADKLRLVLDLRYVNPLLELPKVKFEDWKVALEYLDSDGFVCGFDLRSGYHHIDIHESYQKYLGFAWEVNGHVHYYVFTVLPFGLSTAGQIFTKVLKCLVKHWRSKAIKVVLYLDDGIIMGKDEQEVLAHSIMIQKDLKDAGFVAHDEKSNWTPGKILIWLGVKIDLNRGILLIPEHRLESIFRLIHGFLKNPRTTVRKLASVVGKISSTQVVLGTVTRIMLRNSHKFILNRTGWDFYTNLSREVINELIFWLHSLQSLNSREISRSLDYTLVVFSDASDIGCGGYILQCNEQVSQHFWSEEQKSMSSTWRELKAVHLMLQSMMHVLRGHTIKWYSDNQAVIAIIDHGSTREHLQVLAVQIFYITLRNQITLEMEWVPRYKNQVADRISRFVELDDWKVSDWFFNLIDEAWGPHSVDLFANNLNHKVSKFYSKFWTDGTTGVDAFAYNWFGEVCWIVPPVSMIAKVIAHVIKYRAKGTLIIPYWVSSPFWPLLVNGYGQFLYFVTDVRMFTNTYGVFSEGSVPSIFNECFQGTVLALRLDAA